MEEDEDDLGGALDPQRVHDVDVLTDGVVGSGGDALSDADLVLVIGGHFRLQSMEKRRGVGCAAVVNHLNVVGAQTQNDV